MATTCLTQVEGRQGSAAQKAAGSHFRRAWASGATALVRVTTRELPGASGSAAKETTIFTNPGSSNPVYSSVGWGRNSTSVRHGWQ